MNHYLPSRMIIMSLSQQSLNIGAMHQLGQSKAAEILQGTGIIVEFFMPLTAQSFDGFEVEGVVHPNLGCKIEVIKGESITKKCKFIGIDPGILLNV